MNAFNSGMMSSEKKKKILCIQFRLFSKKNVQIPFSLYIGCHPLIYNTPTSSASIGPEAVAVSSEPINADNHSREGRAAGRTAEWLMSLLQTQSGPHHSSVNREPACTGRL